MIILRDKVYLGQREYGLGSDIWHSGLQRTAKKYIGRGRVKLAKKLTEGVKSNILAESKNPTLIERANTLDSKRPELIKSLNQKAKEQNVLVTGQIPVLNIDEKNAFVITENIQDAGRILSNASDVLSKRAGEQILSGNYSGVISVPSSMGAAVRAHEIGHLQNKTGNSLNKFISSRNNEIIPIQNVRENLVRNNGNNQRRGLGAAFEDYINGQTVLAEEANASRNGKKLLKKSGATSDELKGADDIYETGRRTYYYPARANFLTTLRNTVQIPSRVKNKNGDWIDVRSDLLTDKERLSWNRNQHDLVWSKKK